MKSTLRISLKSGERIFINGAVLRVDRKVALEFLNDVTFLLENHVLQPEQATTPLRQLYFIAQMMLINPEGKDQSLAMFRKSVIMLLTCFENEEILAELLPRVLEQRVECFRAGQLRRRLEVHAHEEQARRTLAVEVAELLRVDDVAAGLVQQAGDGIDDARGVPARQGEDEFLWTRHGRGL